MQSTFNQFRKTPVKTKSLLPGDKEKVRHALTQFEVSEDEEQVDLEGI